MKRAEQALAKMAHVDRGGDWHDTNSLLLESEANGYDVSAEDLPHQELGPVLTCFADVEPREISWLWPGRFPLGRITLLVGNPGEGKSFLTTDMAARVSTGTPWPDGSDCPQGSVILMTAEDDPGDTTRPRLDAHHADVSKVHLLSAVRRRDTDEETYEQCITLADVDAIEQALQQLEDCKLVVVDPIGSYLGGKVDAHRDNAVRAVLTPIASLAEKYGVAVVIVAHRRKSDGNTADDLALGSRAFTGIARAVWHLSRDPEKKSRRLLLPGKNNLSHEGYGLAFSIVDEPPRLAWERDPVKMTADDALALENQSRNRKRGPEPETLNAAKKWLQSKLAQGPCLVEDLKDEWIHGEGGKEHTLQRAKKELKVKAFHPAVPGPWWWRLPANADDSLDVEKLGNLGHLGETSTNLTNLDPQDCKDAKLPELGDLALDPNPYWEANSELLTIADDEWGVV
jgi:RecA/RadA recombinase